MRRLLLTGLVISFFLVTPVFAGDVQDAVVMCKKKVSKKAQTLCMNALREKVFADAKFKLDTLSAHAEKYVKEGRVNKKIGAQFIAHMKQVKQKFNRATMLKTKWEILKRVHAIDWPKFLQQVTFKSQTGDEQVMVWPDDVLTESMQQLQELK